MFYSLHSYCEKEIFDIGIIIVIIIVIIILIIISRIIIIIRATCLARLEVS